MNPALLLFPLSPKHFLVENQLFTLQLAVYIFDELRWELLPALEVVHRV